MQAAHLFKTGDLRLIERAIPEAGRGEVLVKVEASGICGTDRHLLHGEFPCKPPVTLGHEFSGIVVGLGEGVSTIRLGDRVTCDPNIACGQCAQCLKGKVNLCYNNVAVGIHRDGGLAHYAAYPAYKAFVLPADLDPLHGAFCEPLACCIHAVDRAAPKAGEKAIIIGGGVIGLLTLQLARLAGCDAIMLTRNETKRRIADDLGAVASVTSAEAALAIWPEGADLVFECAGVTETVAMTPKLAASGGRIVIVGVLAKGDKVAIEPFDLLFREVDLISSFINPFTHQRATDLVASGRIRIDPLISRVIGLSEAVHVIENPAGPGDVRVIVRPDL